MITENLSTLKIHKLTKEQYEREMTAGNVDETALYLTPYEEVDLSNYVTTKQLKDSIDETKDYIDSQIGNVDFNGLATEEYVNSKFDEVNEQIVNNIAKPDWNQNDANAADFIKNKPFGEEIVEVFNTNNAEF